MSHFSDLLSQMPLVAILRGLRPEEAAPIAQALLDAGFTMIEVPLNSPDPLSSIETIARLADDHAMVGAGTVLTADDAERVLNTGARLVIAPNINLSVAEVVRHHDGFWCPGVFTATEAFSALDAGAAALKLFPAELMPPAGVRALRAVLPPAALALPVGGITPDRLAAYWQAGANGFGLGSALYRPGDRAGDVGRSASEFVKSIRELLEN